MISFYHFRRSKLYILVPIALQVRGNYGDSSSAFYDELWFTMVNSISSHYNKTRRHALYSFEASENWIEIEQEEISSLAGLLSTGFTRVLILQPERERDKIENRKSQTIV